MRHKEEQSRFSLGFEHTIEPRGKGNPVDMVQKYLRQNGYLKPGFKPKVLDAHTENALKAFQRRRRIAETGAIDPDTVAEIEAPRCGVPDDHQFSVAADIDGNTASTCSHKGKSRLTFGFVDFNEGGNLRKVDIIDQVSKAFLKWAEVINIEIDQADPSTNPDFLIGWFDRTHMVGSTECRLRFDGFGRTLAHAFPPTACEPELGGQCHFDISEPWTIGAAGIDLQSLALHEIGHLLGLSHLSNPEAVMFEAFSEVRTNLHRDDKRAARIIYDLPLIELLVHFSDIEDLKFHEDEFTDFGSSPRMLKGFQLAFSKQIPGLRLRYSVRQEDTDFDFVDEGTFIGTRDPASVRHITGFAIQMDGPSANKYDVIYEAKIKDIGATSSHRNGDFCGDRSRKKPIEAIRVRVQPRSQDSSVFPHALVSNER